MVAYAILYRKGVDPSVLARLSRLELSRLGASQLGAMFDNPDDVMRLIES